LLAYGLAGNDTIRLLAGTGPLAGVQLSVPTVIDAGLGNDLVDATGSAGTAILLGRDGNDNLTGGSGRDLLIGGRGKDLLHGGAGDDIVSSGPTTFDADLTGLLSVMTEWSDANTDYVTRVQHLSGTPGGANGPNFLAATTVLADTSTEQLFGDTGRDWFLFTDSGRMVDQVLDVSDGEVLTGL
jgi:Ca2+-binding RTX toxin-like protein